jgi:hypothetical protein
VPKQLLNKKGDINIHHLHPFLLFKLKIAFLVQLSCMSSKHIRISSFGGSHVSRPYLLKFVCITTNQTYNTWFRQLLYIESTFKLNEQRQNGYYIINVKKYTPITSLFANQVSNSVFSSTTLHVEQTYTNNIICIESCFQTVFSTNRL